MQRFREEQGARLAFEKSVREEIEKRWEALKCYVDEEIQSLRESEKVSLQLGYTLSQKGVLQLA